jgi:hypothetical protein
MELHKVPVEVCVDIGVDAPVNLFAPLEHPGVSEACVVGAPDAEWGEVVVAHRGRGRTL